MTDNQAVGALPEEADAAAAAERRLAWLEATVLIDPLTGLGNRRAAARAFEAALASGHRHDAPVAVALVDIDGLKAINDAQGHAAGDAALVAFADALRQSMRADDTAFRFGGDEFVVLAPGATAVELAQLFDRVRLTAPAFTVGIAQAPADGTTEGALVAVADRRMYAARRVAAAGAIAVPGRRRRLVTAAAVLALLPLGVPVLAWARQPDTPDGRATGRTTTTAVTSTAATSTTSTSAETVVTVAAAQSGGPIVTTLPPSRPSVTHSTAVRTAPTSTSPTRAPNATTTTIVEPDYEAAGSDERDKGSGKGSNGRGHGRGRGKP